MKKVLAILLIGILLTSALVGCAAKKEANEPAMQLDMVQMVETAAQSTRDAESELRERLTAPEHVSDTMKLADGKLTVKIDGDVILPDTDQMPMVRVKPAQFSQELVTTMFQRLTAGHTLYNRDIYTDWTKEELQAQIEGIRSTYDNDFYYDDRDAYIADCELEIQQIEKRMKSAPDTHTLPLVPADGTLIPMTSYDRKTGKIMETHLGVLAQSDLGDGTARGYISFQVNNDNDLTEAYITDYDDGQPTGGVPAGHCPILTYSNHEISAPKTGGSYGMGGNEAIIPISDESCVPAEAFGGLQKTPAQARKEMDEILAGTGLAVSRIYLVSANLYENPAAPEGADYAYVLYCARRVDGIPCSFAPVLSDVGDTWEDFWIPRWSNEVCYAMANDGGVLDFYWCAPMEVAETVVASASLLPFTTAIDVFIKMIGVVNADWLNRETLQYISINVDRIELCLERVNENDSIESGMLIPVWKFYGLRWVEFQEGGGYTGGSQSPECILTINAVDGSILTGN